MGLFQAAYCVRSGTRALYNGRINPALFFIWRAMGMAHVELPYQTQATHQHCARAARAACPPVCTPRLRHSALEGTASRVCMWIRCGSAPGIAPLTLSWQCALKNVSTELSPLPLASRALPMALREFHLIRLWLLQLIYNALWFEFSWYKTIRTCFG